METRNCQSKIVTFGLLSGIITIHFLYDETLHTAISPSCQMANNFLKTKLSKFDRTFVQGFEFIVLDFLTFRQFQFVSYFSQTKYLVDLCTYQTDLWNLGWFNWRPSVVEGWQPRSSLWRTNITTTTRLSNVGQESDLFHNKPV